MTHGDFIEWAKQLRDLGAVQVTAGEFSATFAPPRAAVVAPEPRERKPPKQDATAEERKSYRDHVFDKLVNNG